MATIALNQELNGIEISFETKPVSDVLAALKELGFRWHRQKHLWYAKSTPERLEKVSTIVDAAPVAVASEKPAKAEKKAAPVNKYGVKVGDLFCVSWGYEQTNVDFFQVIALVGATSVRIREVNPERIEEETYSHGMARDAKYKLPENGELLPAAKGYCMVNDQENGDLKRVRLGYNNAPCINVGRKGGYQDTAHPYHGETVYESWYY